MDVNGFCNYVHMDKFGRVDKEKVMRKGAEVKVAGKRPSDGSGEGTGEKRQRNGWARRPHQQGETKGPKEGVRLCHGGMYGSSRVVR